jgi:hypothetical protein
VSGVGEGRANRFVPPERERVWVRLLLAYWIAQVCKADVPDHRRVAKDDWRAGEAVEESNSGAKKNRRDVDVDFVEEASMVSPVRVFGRAG